MLIPTEWLPVALAAALVLVLTVGAISIGPGRRIAFLREASVMVLAYAAYFFARGATEGEVARALGHARRLVDVERSLGLFVEPAVQAALIGERWLVDLANWVYVWGFWPVIVAVAIWLYMTRPRRYRLFRNAFLISGAIGLVIFVAFPTAPPRLAGLGLVDTVSQYSEFYRVLQAGPAVNEYAAFPSLHFGWILLIGIAVIREASHPAVRALGALLPPVMLGAMVLTANHYVIDAVAGAAVALIGFALARWLTADASSPEGAEMAAA